MDLRRVFSIIILLGLTSCAIAQSQQTGELTITNGLTGEKVADITYVNFVTQAEKETGLGGTEALGENEGALFVLEDHDKYFWMKNMNYSLDIVFMDNNYKIIQTLHDLEPCTINSCPTFPTPKNASYALELNAGTVEELGIGPGDRINL